MCDSRTSNNKAQRVRVGLEKMKTRVSEGALKKPEKIGATVERALQKNHGYRYYTWELQEGRLVISELPVNLPRENKYEGKYLIQTDQVDMTPENAVEHYKDLSEVERGFRSLKDPLGMRPIWHHKERRVKAHIFVAALGVFIPPWLERRSEDTGAAPAG